ncbi:general stress protein [Cytobacillus gottheilii]|uniref:general stress protein n=1 Tax=Cytobacillus gottheilii TaxID=859144 RepID=UPI0009BBEAA7|nr:general stress protein [Cytobacillus gottheilii]
MATNKQVVGSYTNEREAIDAVERLRADGYRSEDISVISRNRANLEEVTEETGTKAEQGLATGAATGGILGGLTGILAGVGALAIPGIGPIVAAGPIATALAGAAVGAGAGSIAGALIGMGIPEDEANRYEADVKEGNILVIVDSHSAADELASSNDLRNDPNSNLSRKGEEEDPLNPGEMDNRSYAPDDQTAPIPDVNIDPNRPLNERMEADPENYPSGYADEIGTRDGRLRKFNAREDNPFKD